jgi:hypothetical protein
MAIPLTYDPEEEGYEEARRRIRQAAKTGAVELDLSLFALNQVPRELARLTSLQSLAEAIFTCPLSRFVEAAYETEP